MVLAVSSDGALAHRDRVLVVRVTRWDVTDHHMVDAAVVVVVVATAVAVPVAIPSAGVLG